MKLRFLLAAAVSLFTLGAKADCAHPFVYFDLGQTLIDTDTHHYNPMFMMAGAADYLTELRAKGYPIGLISDVPEAWGRDKEELSAVKDYPTAKWMRLLRFIRGTYPDDHTSWNGPNFDESWFGSFQQQGPLTQFNGQIYLPLKDSERKKNGSLVLFQRALAAAQAAGCSAIYEGEDPAELVLARAAGMMTFQVGHDLPNHFYLPVDQIDTYRRAPAPTDAVRARPKPAPSEGAFALGAHGETLLPALTQRTCFAGNHRIELLSDSSVLVDGRLYPVSASSGPGGSRLYVNRDVDLVITLDGARGDSFRMGAERAPMNCTP